MRKLHGSVFIVCAPLLHGIQDRPHGFTEITQSVFYPGRNFREDGSGDQSVFLHGTQGIISIYFQSTVRW